MIIDSFKHYTLTVAMAGSEALPKARPTLCRLKGLYYIAFQEDPSEGLTHTYYKNKMIISHHDLGKIK